VIDPTSSSSVVASVVAFPRSDDTQPLSPVGASLPAERRAYSKSAPTTVHFAKHGAVSYKASDLNGDEKPDGNQLGEVPRVRRFPTSGDRTPSWRVLGCPPFG
jgi:hypothetical protein